MAQEDNSSLDYLVGVTEKNILFRDSNGNQVALVKGNQKTYSILDSDNQERGIMTGWSTPSLAISNMPLYSSSSIIKIYDHEGGEEIERMAVTAQSISSTKMNLSLLDKRDNIIAFLSEGSDSYLIRDACGVQFGTLSRLDSTGTCKIKAKIPTNMTRYVVIKLVVGQILFNSLSRR